MALGIEGGKINPAEIKLITRGPDHRVDILGAKVEFETRSGNAIGIGQPCPRGGLLRDVEPALPDMRIDQVKEGEGVSVTISDSLAQIRRDLDDAVARRLHAPEQCDAIGRNATEIDSVTPISAGDGGHRARGVTLLCRRLVDAEFGQPVEKVLATVATRRTTVPA